MMNVESIDLADETPEVDAAKQRLAVAAEDESGLDTTTSTRLKPVVVFVHVLNADGNLIWAELPSRMGFHEFACCEFSWHRPIFGADQETTAASCGASELMREARASPRADRRCMPIAELVAVALWYVLPRSMCPAVEYIGTARVSRKSTLGWSTAG